ERHRPRLTGRVALDLEDVVHGLTAEIRIIQTFRMGEVRLAGDDVGYAVAIHVYDLHGVSLGETDREDILRAPHELMLRQLPRRRLLVPGGAITVGRVTRDDVHVTVTIDVDSEHVRATGLRVHTIAIEPNVVVSVRVYCWSSHISPDTAAL